MTTIDWVNCECHRCIKVKDNMAKGLWFHQGLGRSPSKFIDAESGTKIKGFHFFEDRGEKNTTRDKPSNAVWFSAGTWLFDPPGSCEDAHEKEAKKYKVVTFDLTQLPKEKVLRITSKKELDDFIDKYSQKFFFLDLINWEKVETDYLAISFEFKKIRSYENKYSWHAGFDVESLVLFKDAFSQIELTIDSVEI